MAGAPEPVLVYTRVAANVRRTRQLVVLFALVLLPVVSAATVLVMPVVSVVSVFVASGAMGSEHFMQRMLSLEGELQAARPNEIVSLTDLPSSLVWLIGGLLIVTLAIVVSGFAAVTAYLVSRYGSRMLLRAAHARPVVAGEESELVRVVENLCIGAGLPMPRLHIMESSSPNAFATGPDPERAALVVTRGLLALVDRRELQAVIAHELSHIGNQDTRLTTILAALVGTTSLPWKIALAPVRFAFDKNIVSGVFVALFAVLVGWQFIWAFWSGLTYLASEEMVRETPRFMWWWVAHAMLAPPYALLVAPLAALVIRQAVSRQREFLADADAVTLTRDPEALALALAKIGTAGGERLRVGEGSVHLYIVDPRGARSLFHWIFPSHPPLQDRLELLANMGSGIPQASLEAAMEAGRQMRTAVSMTLEHRPESVGADPAVEGATCEERHPPLVPAATDQRVSATIPLYEQPDGWSKVLAELDENAALTPVGKEGNFIRVLTTDNIRGYVSSSARLSALRRTMERSEI
jgi:heat shock protein HtpX